MDIRQLQTFATVAAELSFTRAAAELHTVQSAVSATIRSLESDLGVPLFDRSLRQVRLTSAGEALLPEARKVLDAVRAARDAVDATAGEVTGSVAVGYMTSVTLVDIPVLLHDFAERHGRVAITLKAAEKGTAGLIDMLRTGELDVALVSVYQSVPDLNIVPVARSPIHLTVPADHPLVGQGPVSLDRLGGERFIDFPDGYGVRQLTDAAFRAAGIRRPVALETMDIATMGTLVDNGLGIAFLPEFISDRLTRVRVVPLEEELHDMVVQVATLRSRPLSAAARALHSLIVERSA
jgi:DNA-binding transcriptional LysR family regulator